MPLTWVETSESRSATLARKGKRETSQITLAWDVFGSNDDQVVHREANERLSRGTTYVIGDYTFMVESYTLTYHGDKAWRVEALYTKIGAEDDDQRNPLRRTRSFDTSGATQHITQSPLYGQPQNATIGGKATIVQVGQPEVAYPDTAPTQFGAIGVDDNGVNGVDIVVPALTWTETYDVPSKYVTSDYIKRTAFMTGTVNGAAFRSFMAGEVLFLGCSGTQEWDSEKGDGPWSLSYKFSASPNCGNSMTLPALSVGAIGGITKRGHEYMWIRYENTESSFNLLKTPRHVYVDQVYRASDFANLGIGVT